MMAWLRIARLKAVLAFLAVAGLMAGCATPARIAGQPGGAPTFDRTGRFAVNVVYRDGKQDAVQGRFAWQDSGQRLVLDLANPLGSTLARVEVSSGMAVMTRSNGEIERASTADGLVDHVLGSPIPVAGLRDWLRGRTGRDPVQGLERDASGQIAAFTQSGWRVALSRYDVLGPRLLQLSRVDFDRDIRVRLVIDDQ